MMADKCCLHKTDKSDEPDRQRVRGSLSQRRAWHNYVKNYAFHKVECVTFSPMANQEGQRYEGLRCECGNTYNQHDDVIRVKKLGFRERAKVRKRLVPENLQEIVCIKPTHQVERPRNNSIVPNDTPATSQKRSRASNKSSNLGRPNSVFYCEDRITKLGKLCAEKGPESSESPQPDSTQNTDSFRQAVITRANTIRKDICDAAPRNKTPGADARCHCHSVIVDLPKPTETWNPKTAFVKSPTDCYGKINFRSKNRKPAKYIRLSSEDSTEQVYDFVTEEWGIMEPEKPDLVMNICGGLKTFTLHKKTKTRLHEALIRISESTSAWLITSGLKLGVTKLIGEAVLNGQTYSVRGDAASHNIKCIGVVPWGKVANSDLLQVKGSLGPHQAAVPVYEVGYKAYQMSSRDYKSVSLDHHHTHFLLVDNGYRNMFTGPGSIRDFLFMFLRTLTNKGLNVVSVVIGGGEHVFHEVWASMCHGVPVVICEGTHRAADILADAYRHSDENGCLKEDYINGSLTYQVQWLKPKWTNEDDKQTCREMVINCCKEKHMMTLFDVRKHCNMEEAILQAFIKSQSEFYDACSYLELAYACNQADFAETELLKDTQHMPMRKLNNLLHQALIDDRCDFVRLLLRDHVDLSKVLKRSTLIKLYNVVLQQHRADHLLRLLQQAKQDFTFYDSKGHNITKMGTFEVKIIYDLGDIGKVLSKLLSIFDPYVYVSGYTDKETLAHPRRELFIWSLLVNRMVIAKYLWESSDMAVSTALVGSWLCHKIVTTQGEHMDTELLASYSEAKIYFENSAKETIDLMSIKYPEQAELILSEQLTRYNGLTCLQLAAGAHDLDFISAKACQSHMRGRWRGGLKCSTKKVLLSLVLPFFIVSCFDVDVLAIPKTSTGYRHFLCRCVRSLYMYYTSPIVKYICYTLTYILFLLLFTTMVLYPVNSSVCYLHDCMMVCVLAYVCDEIHRFVAYPIPSIRRKLFEVFGVLRVFYVLSSVSCFVAFGFHLYYGYLPWIKLMYCVNMVLFYIRLLRLYTPSKYLGPKLLIIKETLMPLFHFFFILLVYMIAYGVATFATLYPSIKFNASTVNEAIYQIFLLPYWHLYGELMLDNLKDDHVCYSSHNINKSQIDSGLGLPCRTHSPFVTIMLAIYLFFGNVLLLNLIIAIFSQIFTDIQQKSRDHWRFLMYKFIIEYDIKSFLPPPFSLLEYLLRFLVYVYQRCVNRTVKSGVSMEGERVLRWVEEEMCRHYLRHKIGDSDSQLLTIVNNINERVDDLESNLKKVEKFVVEIGSTEMQLRNIQAAISGITMATSKLPPTPDIDHIPHRHHRRKSKLDINPQSRHDKKSGFRDIVSKFLWRKSSVDRALIVSEDVTDASNSTEVGFLFDSDSSNSGSSFVDESESAGTVWFSDDGVLSDGVHSDGVHSDGVHQDSVQLHTVPNIKDSIRTVHFDDGIHAVRFGEENSGMTRFSDEISVDLEAETSFIVGEATDTDSMNNLLECDV